MRTLCLGLLGVLSGCFDPRIAEVACSPLGECPSGTLCGADKICRAPDADADAGTDAGRTIEDPGFPVAHLVGRTTDFGDLNLLVQGTVSIDTSANLLGAPFNRNLTSVQQAGQGPQTTVLLVRRLEITAGSKLIVRGARPLIIISELGIQIDGVLDASAVAITPGPGASSLGRGADGASIGSSHAASGGGAFETVGGDGGSTEAAVGGLGGMIVGDATLTTLLGGSPGGDVAIGVACQRSGGGAGGAVQLSSPLDISIGLAGAINAAGGGGQPGGPCPNGRGGPGAGGGSGGAIYLQANHVSVVGALIANGGGGGGGGGDDNGQDGEAGEDGNQIAAFARGGNGGDDSGDGGAGGGLVGAPGNGGAARNSNGGGAGGGGAAGRIAIDGTLTTAAEALISPPASGVD